MNSAASLRAKAKYRAKNRAALRQKNRDWYSRTRPTRLAVKKENYRRTRRFHPLKDVFTQAKTRCAKRGIPFTLDSKWLAAAIQIKTCCKTGLPLVPGGGPKIANGYALSPSLDRKDHGAGYTADNVQVVCWWYNMAKNKLTDQQVAEMCRAVVETYDRRGKR